MGKVSFDGLKNENGELVSSQKFEGRFYVASFFFSRCPTVCPKTLGALKIIQKRLKGVGTKAAILTFSVDPKFDSPEVLFKVAREQKANPYMWSFLTGDEAYMGNMIRNAFKLYVGPGDSIMAVAHADKFVLVDAQGNIRGYYGNNRQDIDKMMIDLGLMINV